MTIEMTATKRAQGVLCAQVHLGDAAADGTLVVRNATTSGTELPVRLVHGEDDGDWTVVVPALAVTQVLTLAASSWEGEPVEERTQKINPITTRLASPVDVLARRGRRMKGEVPDGRPELGVWDITVERLVAGRDGNDVCHGHAVLVADAGLDTAGPLEVCALDGHGVSLGAWTCLDDRTEPVPGHPAFSRRRIEFSLRVPSATSTLVVWVRPQDGEDGSPRVPSGFICLGPRLTAGLREVWKAVATPAHDDEGYDTWFSTRHAATPVQLAMQRESSSGWNLRFSVVSVLRGMAGADALRGMVDSVLEQSYDNLELVLVNAAPNDRRLAASVRSLEIADARVRSVPLGADFGVAAATSEGLDAATGDFACLLREGDLLAPDALFCLAQTVKLQPTADVLYTDEDGIERGQHVRPVFKPDWDPDLLRGTYYLGGLLAVRCSLLRDMEPMDRTLDGAEAYHLALYATDAARSVCHVPRVLYHVRADRHMPAPGASGQASGLVALRQHLERTETAATARMSTRVANGYDVAYDVADAPLVSVVIISRDDVAALDRCLTSLRERTTYENYEVIIVEQGSVNPQTFSYYRQAEEADPRVRTIFRQGDGSFDRSRLLNFGVSRARGDYLLFLSCRTEVTDGGWMSRLLSLCAREGTGAVGGRLVRPDGTISSSGGFLSVRGPVALDRYCLATEVTSPQQTLPHLVTVASGACLMVDMAAFRKIGGMSTSFPGRFGDADLCLRLRGRGYRVLVDPQVTLVHHHPLSDDATDQPTVERLRAIGRLWDAWPHADRSVDPTIGPNVDPDNGYRALPD